MVKHRDHGILGWYKSGSEELIPFLCLCNNHISPRSAVKLTSPYLNVVIIIGGIFFYVDVILFGIDGNTAPLDTVDRLCQVSIVEQKSLLERTLFAASKASLFLNSEEMTFSLCYKDKIKFYGSSVTFSHTFTCFNLQARIWVSSIGFSLFFGPILAKSFRVYYIFRSIKLKKKVRNQK